MNRSRRFTMPAILKNGADHARLVLIVLLVPALMACGSGSATPTDVPASPTALPEPSATATNAPAPTATSAAVPTTAPSPTVTQQHPSIDLPESPVGEQLRWALNAINSGESELTTSAMEAVFAESVFSELPPAQLGLALRSFSISSAPLTFDGFAAPPGQTQATAFVTTRTGDKLLLEIAVEPAPPHLITVLFFHPAPVATTFGSWEDFSDQLSALAPARSVLVIRNVPDVGPIHASDPDARLAVGSSFKLYVLGELARQVETGAAAWDDEIAIEEHWKSLPSGTLQDSPAGTMVTLQRLAELMISISDNTATDHLIHHLGRDNVAAMQAVMGHGEPNANDPFLTTREMFILKLALPDERLDIYLAGTPDERRTMLDTEIAQATVTLDDASAWSSPLWIEEIEWFASAADLAAAMIWLAEASARPGLEPLSQILSINPGVPIDGNIWSWVGFKGGSEPGVLNLTWLLERTDGQTFVVSVGLNDATANIDESLAVQHLMGAMQLLASEQ